MKKVRAAAVLSLLLCACSGISIKPVKLEKTQTAHDVAKSGYIVYNPAVLIPVTSTPVCIRLDRDGKCIEQAYECTAGKPILVPDYSKPFTVEVKSGFGRAASEIIVTDGWLLGSLKDSSDNTAIIGDLTELITSLPGFKAMSTLPVAPRDEHGCSAAGLYQVDMVNGALVFRRVSLGAGSQSVQ